jgi:transcriptional regulator with XRE-family HTH domain
MTITPGTYLQRRRLAAGLSIDDVARLLDTEPHINERGRSAWLELVEADAQPVSLSTLVALKRVYPFDITVIFTLERIRQGSAETPPRLCRVCACSQLDACVIDPPSRTCWWASEDLCSGCPTRETAIVDEREAA